MLGMILSAIIQTQPSSAVTPHQVIQEARRAWAAEGGRIWGRSLAGPLLVVDPDSRKVWASEVDCEGHLQEDAGIFTGTFPKNESVANTAVDWAGKRWTMVVLPLPEDVQKRHVLLIHESWHRIQPSLGLNIQDRSNGHLDTLEGRYWLQLEWRALAKAFKTSGKNRRTWVAAALACRTRRQNLFSQAAEAERSLELAEGLPEYTGIRAAGTRDLALEKLRKTAGPHARSFAYTSGPAYGLLLDDRAPGWTRRVRLATDLSVLLQEAYLLPTATLGDAEAAAAKLGGAELRVREESKEQTRKRHLAAVLDPLTKGPTLRLPGKFKVQFNPSNTEAIDGFGAYHPTATYLGDWGKLVVTGGSLRSEDWSEVRVIAPSDPKNRPLSGRGWTLELSPGWTLVAIEPSGSFMLAREKLEK